MTALQNQYVVSTAAPLFSTTKDALVHKILYVAKSGSSRGLRHFCPFAGIELALKSVPKPVDNFDLPFVQCNRAVFLPEQGFLYHPLGLLHGGVNGIKLFQMLCDDVKKYNIRIPICDTMALEYGSPAFGDICYPRKNEILKRLNLKKR